MDSLDHKRDEVRCPHLHTVKYKVVFVGDSAVGKSSLIGRMLDGVFIDTAEVTLDIDMRSQSHTVHGQVVQLQLWDTPGSQEYWPMMIPYLHGAAVVVVVYDITDRQSFSRITQWLNEVQTKVKHDMPLAVVGTKVDRHEERQVSCEEGATKAKEFTALFAEVSAKDGWHVADFTQQLLSYLPKSALPHPDHHYHTLSVTALGRTLGTSLNSLEVSKSAGLTSEMANQQLAKTGRNVISIDAPLAPETWDVDPIEVDDPLDNIYVSNEIGDLEVGALAALPRPMLELFTIHILSNIRGHGYQITDFMDHHWTDRWHRWLAKERIQRANPHASNASTCMVQGTRNGRLQSISIEELVPGDLLRLRAGEMCPADVVFIHIDTTEHLELSLAGISGVVRSGPRTCHVEWDQHCGSKNIGLMGATVVSGAGYAVVTATGRDTALAQCLKEVKGVQKLPPPRGVGFNAAGTHPPIHFDSPKVVLNNRSITHQLAFLTTIVADREALLVCDYLHVTHVILGTDILEWTSVDDSQVQGREGVAEQNTVIHQTLNTLDHSTLGPKFSSPPTKNPLAVALHQEEAVAEQNRKQVNGKPPQLHVGPFRLYCNDLPVGSVLRSDALDRLAMAAVLASCEPPSSAPINKVIRQWAASFPFAAELRAQYSTSSSCFFPLLNLHGSLHLHIPDSSRRTDLLVIHGVAHRVFHTSNHVLTSKGSVPMSSLQKELFRNTCATTKAPADYIYGFAVMEVDLSRKYKSTAPPHDFDVMELLKNAEGLCFIGSVVIKEMGRDDICQGFHLAKEMGIKVILCTSDSRAALEVSVIHHQAAQHEEALYLDGNNMVHQFTRHFWTQHYEGSDIFVYNCSASTKQSIVDSLHIYRPSLAIAMIGASAVSLAAMAAAHFSIFAPFSTGSPQCLVDGVPLNEFLTRRADLILRGSLADLLAVVTHSRRHNAQS